MNRAEIYSFPDYEGIYAAGIPFEQDGKEGSLIIYKNVSNGKEFGVIKTVIKHTNDTVVKIYQLRNVQDGLEIVYSKSNSTINLRPNCDPKKECHKGCASWTDCIECTIGKIENDPINAITCMAFGQYCAAMIVAYCTIGMSGLY